MTARIYYDRPLTGAERTARYKARHPEYAKAYREAHPEKWKRYNETQKLRRRELGRRRYVYMYVSPKGYAAYVGRGSSQRIKAHVKDSPWYEADMILHFQEARNEWHAMQLEGEWGERFQPRFNIEGIRDHANWQDEAATRRMVI